MKSLLHLLQIDLPIADYKFALLGFLTAFAFTAIVIPPFISWFKNKGILDMPGNRKEHSLPIPTMGGIALVAGMMISLLLWFSFSGNAVELCFLFSILILSALGIMDDLKDLQARYKFMIQIALASMIALSGIRITSFGGLFGINELPLSAQYIFTILVIVGITNAFNLIDGIDGLAGGLGFMSLVTLGIFLTMSNDKNVALIAFSLAGAILAFLYFNLHPAKIFMGDTGSLVLGFIIAVLCIRMMQLNMNVANPVIEHAPLFALGIVLIPVFDTIRVFGIRIWKGGSPFVADKTHIHHLLTTSGFSHGFTSRLICFVHGLILLQVYWLNQWRGEWILIILVAIMLTTIILFKNLYRILSITRLFYFIRLKKESISVSDMENLNT
jgi:UDP-N-acetylmuramyl pentapeptide phosphotransferase/UDP-N-acetylglucosamine-1-phosphate transferase